MCVCVCACVRAQCACVQSISVNTISLDITHQENRILKKENIIITDDAPTLTFVK